MAVTRQHLCAHSGTHMIHTSQLQSQSQSRPGITVRLLRPPRSDRHRALLLKCSSSSSTTKATADGSTLVHDGRLPLPQQLQQFISPKVYGDSVLQGHKFAWGKTTIPPQETLFVADPATARNWLSNEHTLGIATDWLENIKALLGDTTVTMTQDTALHTRLRQLMAPYFTAEAIHRQMPAIHGKVKEHMTRWCSEGTVAAHNAARLLTFDILVNQALSLKMDDQELQKYSQVFNTWVDGFIPPAIDLPFLPFGKGMKARRVLQERVRQALSDPEVQSISLLARLRDEFGADSSTAVDNVVNLLFAGHDTTSSAMSYLLWNLTRNPEVLHKLREEHKQVVAKHGLELTPAAIAAMPYTRAIINENLRLAQVVAYVPRVAKKPLTGPSGDQLVTSGCPFIIALAQISDSDPAVSPSRDAFMPERWLDAANAKTLAAHQHPFGLGQHYCVGSQLAQAEMMALLTEVARSYDVVAEVDTEWVDFPIKRPANGLPCKVVRLANV